MLGILIEHLAPHGVLVATFHGAGTLALSRDVPLIETDKWSAIVDQSTSLGFGFASYADSPDESYGISLTTPAWLLDMASRLRGVRIANFTERGWADHHDVLALERTDRSAIWSA
jgi:hypothetical protein